MGFKVETLNTDCNNTLLVELLTDVDIDGEAIPSSVFWSHLKPIMPTFVRLTRQQFYALNGAGRIHHGSMSVNYDLGIGVRLLIKNNVGRSMVVNAHGEPVFKARKR